MVNHGQSWTFMAALVLRMTLSAPEGLMALGESLAKFRKSHWRAFFIGGANLSGSLGVGC